MRKWRTWLRTVERAGLTAWFALRDPRVPLYAKLVQVAGLAYLFLPVDLIPDVIPIIGLLDDMAIMPLVTYAFFKIMPQNVLSELRGRADQAVDKWGNWVIYAVIGLVVLWLALALIGGYLLLSSAVNHS